MIARPRSHIRQSNRDIDGNCRWRRKVIQEILEGSVHLCVRAIIGPLTNCQPPTTAAIHADECSASDGHAEDLAWIAKNTKTVRSLGDSGLLERIADTVSHGFFRASNLDSRFLYW
jgi:hypothetical protein